MFRLLRFFITLSLIFLSVVTGYLWITRISTLEHFFSKRFNIDVRIDHVSCGWDRLTIENLRLRSHPSQYSSLSPLEIEKVTLHAPLWKLLLREKHISFLKLSHVTLGIECFNYSGSEHNWANILNGHSRSTAPLFCIDEIQLDDVNAKIITSTGKEYLTPIIATAKLRQVGYDTALSFPRVNEIVISSLLLALSNQEAFISIADKIDRASSVDLQTPHSDKWNLRAALDQLKTKSESFLNRIQDLF